MRKLLRCLTVVVVFSAVLTVSNNAWAVTSPPTLTLPATSTTYLNTAISVSYNLPQAPTPGSVTLTFAGASPCTLSMNSSQVVSFTLNGASPLSSAQVVSSTCGSIANGTYSVTISYQNTVPDPAATATTTSVTIIAPPTATFAAGALTVTGVSSELVTLSCSAGNLVFAEGTVTPSTPTCASISSIRITFTGSGANTVNLNGLLAASFTNSTLRATGPTAFPVIVYLGDGNDVLSAGSSNVGITVVGGPGADTVTTGSGYDNYVTAVGDTGTDTVDLGANTDIVIGAGSTAADGFNVAPSAANVAFQMNPLFGSTATTANVVAATLEAFTLIGGPFTENSSLWYDQADGDDQFGVNAATTQTPTIYPGGGNDTMFLSMTSGAQPTVWCTAPGATYSSSVTDYVQLGSASALPYAIDTYVGGVSSPYIGVLASYATQPGYTTTPATFVNCIITNTSSAPSINGGQYRPLTPYRIYDTRTNTTPVYAGAGLSLEAGVARSVQVGNTGSTLTNRVPLGAAAVVLNVTVTDPQSAGFLKVYPTGTATPPNVSSLNVKAGEVRANNVTVTLPSDGYIDFLAQVPMNLIVDVQGYYLSTSEPLYPTGRFRSMSPQRIFDTRPGTENVSAWTSGLAGPTTAGQTFNVDVAVGGSSFLGDDIRAVVMNVTAIGLSTPGFVTVWPTGETRPNVSNVNFSPGAVVPNLVVVPVGTSGDVSVYTSSPMHLLADVQGYFTASGVFTAGRFQAVTPARVIDSRDTGQLLTPAAGAFAIQVDGTATATGAAPIPAGKASAVVANVTAVPTQTGYVSVFPNGTSIPLASNLNTVAPNPVPNAVWSQLSAGGAVATYFQGAGYVIVDVNGWFTAT